MRPLSRMLAATLILAAVAQPVAAAELDLRPIDDWRIDYAEDSCALFRSFGEGERLVLLEMRQYSPERPDFQIIVRANGLRVPNFWRRGRSSVRLLPDEEGRTFIADEMHFPDFDEGAMFVTALWDREMYNTYANGGAIPPERFDQRHAAIIGIELTSFFNKDVVLQTGSLAAPMQAMRTCLEELQSHWGIDVAAHRTLSRRVEPVDFERWVELVQRSYPSQHLNAGRRAVLRLRLDVSAEGRPTGCHGQSRVGEEDFESTACATLIQNAIFLPALDAGGTPIASYHVMAVNYWTP